MYPIPANATRIRYLESTRTQYIDTGIVPYGQTGIELYAWKPDISGTSKDFYVLGLRDGSGDKRWCIGYSQTSKWYFGYGTFVASNTDGEPIRTSLNFLADGKFIVGTSYSYNLPSLSFSPTNQIRLFGSSGMTEDFSRAPIKIARCRISQGTSIVRDFVPVRVGQVGYLFDRVSGQLFGNAGTGNFTIGPDTFATGVLPTRMCVMGVRNTEVLGSVLISRNTYDAPLYAANVFSSIPSNWTVSLWAKEAVSPAHGGFFKLGNQANAGGVGLGIGNGPEFTSDSGDGTKLIALREGEGWDKYTSVASIDSWHHYAISVNGTTKIAYVDGVVVGTKTGTLRTAGACDFAIGNGGVNYPTLPNQKRLFSGNITRVALWNRTLSASEIASDYADGKKSPSVTSGLSHYWPLQNAKNYLKDEVGSATLSVGTSNVTISNDTPFA